MRTTLSSATYIINELDKRGLHGVLYHTGGGCTAVEVEVLYITEDGNEETGLVVITDVSGTTVSVDIDYEPVFLGWVAGFYVSEDGFSGGDEAEWIHAEAYEREETVARARGEGNEFAQAVLENLRQDWQTDADVMVAAVATFIEEKKRG